MPTRICVSIDMVNYGVYTTRSYPCEILYIEVAFETTVATIVAGSIIDMGEKVCECVCGCVRVCEGV